MDTRTRLDRWIKAGAIILSLPGIGYVLIGLGAWTGVLTAAPEYIALFITLQCLFIGLLWLAVVIPLYFLARSYASLWKSRYLS